jgi:hypothetical protein
MRIRISLLATGFVLLVTACSVTIEQPETTTSIAATTQTTLPGLEPLVLTPDGLGAISFGAHSEGVVADLTSRFGAPDRDSGWEPPDGIYGSCPGVAVRTVGWGSFEALFTDAGADRLPEFFAWTYGFDLATSTAGVDPRGLDLRTAEGIGLGNTRADFEVAYGDRWLDTSDGSGLSWSFHIYPDDPTGMRGLLDGGNDASPVTFIESAPGCDPGREG